MEHRDTALSAQEEAKLGAKYFNGDGVPKNLQGAIKHFTLAANQGNVDVQVYLASMYYDGDGVPKDLQKAFKFYTLAANQGERSPS